MASRTWVLLGVTLALLTGSSNALGQMAPPRADDRILPGSRPVEPPPVMDDEAEPSLILPPVPGRFGTRRGDHIGDAPRLHLRQVRLHGNTVFSDAQLAPVIEPYLGRSIRSEDVLALRDALTLFYYERGFLNSGATIPDQAPVDGSIEIRIVEGRLGRIEIVGNRRLRKAFLRKRLALDHERPLNMGDIETGLRFLLRTRGVTRANAEVLPGEEPGLARLRIRIDEKAPIQLWADVNNGRSPAIGAYQLQLGAGWDSLAGHADVLDLNFSISEGLREVRTSYEIPLNGRDGVFGLHYVYSTGDIVEEPVSELGISSHYVSVAASLRQPIYRRLDRQLLVGALFEWRRSRTFILSDLPELPGDLPNGIPESFTPGTLRDEGLATVSVLRGYLEWSQNGRGYSGVLRSTLSFGLDVLGATMNPHPVEDGSFISWLTQAQWIQRFEDPRVELLVRGSLQLTNNPLLPMERFSVGGRHSVRGYRENRLVRDNGWTASIEARFPIWTRADGTTWLQLAVFVDAGRSWWAQDRLIGAQGQYLAGVGWGLRFSPRDWLYAELYWGHPIIEAPGALPDRDAQDDGIYFRVTALAF
jgi:hemolysin activation/secretion protein